MTDVVDSTALNDTIGDDAMRAVWRDHDLLARERMAAWRGREIARSDGFLVLFQEATDAVSFAVDYHACLSSSSSLLQARVGIHVGPVSLRENSSHDRERGAPMFEVEGIALPITSRVMAAARGGQTLVTAAVARLLIASLWRIVSHGYWYLKGVAEPVELLEVGDAQSPFEAPADSAKAFRVIRMGDAWWPLRKIANNLPAERNNFVGRRPLLQRLAHLIAGGARLVTLVGMGGVGKTRLALHYARSQLGEYTGGVYFCDLSAAASIDGIAHGVAVALDVALAKANVIDHLANTIRGRGHCLLVLDNFEQISEFAETIVGTWLERAPEANFLVTSREVLSISGEQTLFIAPLETEEGQQLFESRARGITDDFPTSPGEDAAVKALVALLDNLPLAIELAAARVRVMSPSALLRRMHERFTLLAAPGRPLTRQATLRATLDWSWELLRDFERSALGQLTVFEGGFQLEAAEAILDVGDFDTSAFAIDAVQSLVDKSLVRRLDGERFDLLVTVRSYVVDRLQRSSLEHPALEAIAGARDRHLRYYAHEMGEQPLRFASRELDNIITACRYASDRGEVSEAISALENAWTAIQVKGPLGVALDLAALLEGHKAVSDSENARLNCVAGSALYALGRVNEAGVKFDNGLVCAVRAGDQRIECLLRRALGDHDAAAGRMEDAHKHLEAARRLAELCNEPELECLALNSLGDYRVRLGQLDQAFDCFEHALRLARLAGLRRLEGGISGNLGLVRLAQGRHVDALPLYENSYTVACELGDRSWEGNALCNLGMTSQALGRVEDATRQSSAALQIARDLGQRRLQAFALCNLGLTLLGNENLSDAIGRFKEALALARDIGDRRLEGQFHVYAATALSRIGKTSESLEHVGLAETMLDEVADPFSLGLAVARHAEIEHRAGHTKEARKTLQRAEAIASDLQPSSDSEFGIALSEARQALELRPNGH